MNKKDVIDAHKLLVSIEGMQSVYSNINSTHNFSLFNIANSPMYFSDEFMQDIKEQILAELDKDIQKAESDFSKL